MNLKTILFIFLTLSFKAFSLGPYASIMKKYADNKIFNGSVLITDTSGDIFSGSYGHANLEFSVPNNNLTRFNSASLGKQYTSTAILKLEEMGLLQTSDLLSEHMQVPSSWAEITIHHLLTHTSGITRWVFLKDPDLSGVYVPRTAKEHIELLKSLPLDFKAGQKWSYSNEGYRILGYLIKKLSKKSYDEFLREQLYSKLFMNNTGEIPFVPAEYLGPGAYTRGFVEFLANGYVMYKGSIKNELYVYFKDTHSGPGSTYSTMGDFKTWSTAIRESRVLNSSQTEKLFKKYIPANYQLIDGMTDTHYGYGWFISQYKGKEIIWHPGSTGTGHNAIHLHVKEVGLSVTLFSNFQNSDVKTNGWFLGEIAKELIDTYLVQ